MREKREREREQRAEETRRISFLTGLKVRPGCRLISTVSCLVSNNTNRTAQKRANMVVTDVVKNHRHWFEETLAGEQNAHEYCNCACRGERKARGSPGPLGVSRRHVSPFRSASRKSLCLSFLVFRSAEPEAPNHYTLLSTRDSIPRRTTPLLLRMLLINTKTRK